jgi:hypothetical protein
VAWRSGVHVDEETGGFGLQPSHQPYQMVWQGVGKNDVPDPDRSTIVSGVPVIGRLNDPGAPALILLTATITPRARVPALVRTEPADRLDDYRLALSFYLSLPDSVVDRVVFAENSAGDLGQLEAAVSGRAAGKEVELLSFEGVDYPVEHGRGVGETRLIETALERSRLLKALGDDGVFWKLTGRLRFTNLERLIATAPSSCALYADFRRYPHPWVDTRVFASTPRAFRGLFLPRLDLMRQDELDRTGYSAPEERLFSELLDERSRWPIVPRLRVEPTIEGYSGQGGDYARPTRRVWSRARGVIRRVFPGLWI